MKLTKLSKVLIYLLTIGVTYGYTGLLKLTGQAVKGDNVGLAILIVWSLGLVWWCMNSIEKENKQIRMQKKKAPTGTAIPSESTHKISK